MSHERLENRRNRIANFLYSVFDLRWVVLLTVLFIYLYIFVSENQFLENDARIIRVDDPDAPRGDSFMSRVFSLRKR